MTITIDFTELEAVNLAVELRSAAQAAYTDDRLNCAETLYRLAAKAYAKLGGPKAHARWISCRAMADAIRNEMLAIAAGDKDEADYLGTQNLAAVKEAA
jgi:hypothetical protein